MSETAAARVDRTHRTGRTGRTDRTDRMDRTDRIEDVPWEECFLPAGRNPQLEREMRRTYGTVPGHAPYFAECPWVPRADAALMISSANLAHLDLEQGLRIGLVVSQDNSCRYCFASVRALMRLRGVPEERIRCLEQDVLVEDFPERDRAGLALARRLSRADPLPRPEDLQPLRELGYREEAVQEVACTVAAVCFANRCATFPAVPPQAMEPAVGERLHRLIERKLRDAPAEFFASEARGRDFAYVAEALGGLPLGRGIVQAIEGAWSCPHLSRRAKALVIAVVARGLGCALSLREATRILGEEGLPPEELERVLRDLASPALTPVEAVAVPFARETIWYRPDRIQRRAHEVLGQLTRPQFLDLVGTTALANALCRLGPVLPEAG